MAYGIDTIEIMVEINLVLWYNISIGNNRGVDTPVPIPNTEVKHSIDLGSQIGEQR